MIYRRAFLYLILLSLVYILLGCDYARMREQASIRTYEAEPPEMPDQSIPIDGGAARLKTADLQKMVNPLPETGEVIERGRIEYGYFCVMCHGQNGDGRGTVGQSFAPLPTDLRSPYVQNQGDGILFYRVNFGYQRHPPLYSTLGQENSWAVIRYVRAMGAPR